MDRLEFPVYNSNVVNIDRLVLLLKKIDQYADSKIMYTVVTF